MAVAILIPTYNEKENLSKLLERIFALKVPDLSAIIIDDNSPDGTAELAEEFAKKYPVRVIRRPRKMGLGTAYVDAFREILKNKGDRELFGRFGATSGHGASVESERVSTTLSEPRRGERGKPNDLSSPDLDTIIQMDADFSHNPNVIPALLEHIKDYDLVLGSRYIAGGGIENWDYTRRMVSKFGNFYAGTVLGLPYRDLTGGFKCWRREVLEHLDLEKLSSTGYNFQIETTYFAHRQGRKICEIPIIFTERKFGVSKFNLAIMLESFWKVLVLRIKK